MKQYARPAGRHARHYVWVFTEEDSVRGKGHPFPVIAAELIQTPTETNEKTLMLEVDR